MRPYYERNGIAIYAGDCLEVMPSLEAGSVQTCVTSPPYFGLRDYGVDDQIGLERTPAEYVAKLVDVFREVWRVLKDDGTLWLNLGDSYAGMKGASGYELPHKAEERRSKGKTFQRAHNVPGYREVRPQDDRAAMRDAGLKAKDLIGIPWRVAFALQADGWYLRSDIVWHKPNPMPESVTDRPTQAHEYLFLLTKQEKYYYDADAIKEPAVRPGDIQTFGGNKGRNYNPAPDDPNFRNGKEQWGRTVQTGLNGRNRRSVWTVATTPYSGAHSAVMPSKLAEPCILAGSRPGDMVLDPFTGAGTTLVVAKALGRRGVGVELSSVSCEEAANRLAQDVLPLAV